MGREIGCIESELNEIYRRILGVEYGTCMSAVRHELGVSTQLIRANAASLRFRHHVLGLPKQRLTRMVYDELLQEKKGKNYGYRNNIVLWHYEVIAKEAKKVLEKSSNNKTHSKTTGKWAAKNM